MHPQKTYELKIAWNIPAPQIPRYKKKLIDFLLFQGVESFVEGFLEVDINQNQDEPPRDHYGEMGGDASPMAVYRYSRESLDDLQGRLNAAFGKDIDLSLHSMETTEWMDGWKDSFKPFSTDLFYVRPPWEKPLPREETPPNTKPLIEVVIEPGMAFGTGQHATTRLCLQLLGDVVGAGGGPSKSSKQLPQRTLLDVGTGTGILAIAAKKLGFTTVCGTDIEEDALLAARENAKLNGVDLDLYPTTFPRPVGERLEFDGVFANILAVVILRLMPQLVAHVKSSGFLILSGILEAEAHEVQDSAISHGMVAEKLLNMDGWSALLLRKPS